MTEQEKMTRNCILTWKMKDQIALCHLNIIIIYSIDGMATTV